ncbi:MAG: Hsp70 family protein [Chloroflexi bacterium]|nr:Hsp70 family protein [Chloroflexota bacterium]
MPKPIGIDLGTTYTVVATVEGGRPMVVPNAEGQRLTPSVVAFTSDGKTLVGQPARRQAASNPEGTVLSIKRCMGSGYRAKVREREHTPQEVSSLVLHKVKADAERVLGETIHQAVITVPAYFNELQRQATREAALLAGLDVLRLLNEPTATALAYGLHREDAHTILVWDLGGGTFDVSILELGEGIFEVRAVSGDAWLGGDDYDQRLAAYLAEQYRQARGVDFPNTPEARQQLREAAERAKVQLSPSPGTRVSLDLPGDDAAPRVWKTDVTRECFERLTADLLQRMVGPTRQALRDADLTPAGIDRVVLAGGATRMPALRALVKEMFGKEPYRSLDPDEVVAMGAAVQAAMLLGLLEKVVLLDVLPLSLGVETQAGFAARIIPRNTPLPASASRVFTTAADGQTAMDIHVLQGEGELASDNISLGQLRLEGIPSAPRGVPKVEVGFQADVDGLLHVSALDLLGENQIQARLACSKALDPSDLEGKQPALFAGLREMVKAPESPEPRPNKQLPAQDSSREART